jgi:hypothetical protein
MMAWRFISRGKNDIFLFQLPPGYGSGIDKAERPGSLKYFEVRSVLGKELCFDKRLL